MAQDEAQHGQFSVTSGDVHSIAVQVGYGPLFISVAGVWLGTYDFAESAQPSVLFALLLRQDGTLVTGTALEALRSQDGRYAAPIVSDLRGTLSQSGLLVATKTYRDRPDLHSVEQRGQLSTDARAIGGSWSIPERGRSGTFVLRRATVGLDAKQW